MQNKNSVAYALFETWRNSYEKGSPKPPAKLELKEMTKEKAHETVAEMFKYIFDYLNIKPLELTTELSEAKLKELKLGNIFLDCLIFPPEYASKRFSYVTKINYVARLLYPSYFSPFERSEEYVWLLEYLRCEQCKEVGSKYKIVLTGDTVRDRHKLEYMLSYYIKNHPIAGVDNDVKKMYDFFASTKVGRYLSGSVLKKAIDSVFESPLEALHYTYPECQRSEFLYNYELFKKAEESNWEEAIEDNAVSNEQ